MGQRDPLDKQFHCTANRWIRRNLVDTFSFVYLNFVSVRQINAPEIVVSPTHYFIYTQTPNSKSRCKCTFSEISAWVFRSDVAVVGRVFLSINFLFFFLLQLSSFYFFFCIFNIWFLQKKKTKIHTKYKINWWSRAHSPNFLHKHVYLLLAFVTFFF